MPSVAVPCARMANIELINTVGVAKENRTRAWSATARVKFRRLVVVLVCVDSLLVQSIFSSLVQSIFSSLPDFCRCLGVQSPSAAHEAARCACMQCLVAVHATSRGPSRG